MPRTYKTADKLKKDILGVAERLFKEHGYDRTTYQMISDELGISKSAIAYHFKAKSWILFTLFKRYMDVGYSYIRENMVDDFNFYKYHCAAHIFFYRKLMKDRRNWTLFYHKDNMSIWENERIAYVVKYFREIRDDFKKEYDDEELRVTAIMNLGAKASMFDEFSQSPEEMSVDRYCFYLAYLIGMLSMLDEATIKKNIARAFEFADCHTIPGIYLLD